MTTSVHTLGVALLMIGALSAETRGQVAAPAADQPAAPPVAARQWEFEIHTGVSVSAATTGGSGTLPATVSTSPGFRASATSFYFGDGTRFFNQAVATLSGAPTIVALDPVLLGRAIDQSSTVLLGVRISRALARHLALEGTIESGPGAFAFTSSALANLEATRASYIPALQRVLAGTAPAVTSVTTITDHQSPSQVVMTGSVVVPLLSDRKAVPYVVAGAGTLWSGGTMPSATLTGQFTYGTVGQITSTDAIALSYGVTSFRPVVVAGGGVKFHVHDSWGLRLDARAHICRSPVTNLLNANPTTALSAGSGPYPLINVGALQFSTTGSLSGISVAAVPGTKFVTGNTLPTGTSTWSDAVASHVGITLGIFWRF